ncbi:MAG: hypothetical protein ACI4PK_02875 [Oscillospiraceae bacterium]
MNYVQNLMTPMIKRIDEAMKLKKPITGADSNFYLRELEEAKLVSKGINYETVHSMALKKYNVSEYDLYHPDVIKKFPSWFNNSWFEYWGLKK